MNYRQYIEEGMSIVTAPEEVDPIEGIFFFQLSVLGESTTRPFFSR